MNTREAMVYGLNFSGRFLAMMTADLTPEQLLHRPCEGANCAAWLLGHLIDVDRRGYARLGFDAGDLPAVDEDFAKRFGRADDAPKADEFGDVSKLAALFQETHAAFVAKVPELTDEQLAAPIENAPFTTVEEMLLFFPIHIASHAGQISTIRRSLGMPPVI